MGPIGPIESLICGCIALVILGVLAVAAFIVVLYNRLVRGRLRVENAWSQIDVQLKRRHDLIPNLVETVKGYASHERDTLEATIQARNAAVSATGVAQQAGAENMLTQALGKLFALSEAYPDLKANTNFQHLQEELVSTENKIGFARQHYNDTVASYNAQIEAFPSNLVANPFHFEKRQFFEIEEPTHREAPSVSF